MSTITTLTRTARTLADDSDLREQIVDAYQSSRRAVFRPASKPTRLRRAGTAVQSVGAVVTRAGAKAEAQRRARRRAALIRGGAAAGAVAAAAAAVLSRRGTNPNGGPNV